MACSVYVVNLAEAQRYQVASLMKHTDMSQWLKNYGDQIHIYEIWKTRGIHSRWIWKEKKGKWGRMATPRKKQREGTN